MLDVTRRRRHRPRGQAMVEFALVAPIFFLLVFSVLQFGILFGGQNGLVAATRELARYAAPFRVKTATDANNVCADTRLSRQLTAWLSASIPGYASANVESRTATYSWQTNPNNGTYYVQLEVHVSYHYPLFVPIVGGIIDGFDPNPWKSDQRFMLDAREQMRIENEDLTTSYSSVTCPI